MIKNVFTLSILTLLITGCASTTNLYDWGQYEETLFVVYHEPEYKEEALNNYLIFVREQRGSTTLAPGLYAEAGTFMLEQGDIDSALVFYRMEYEAWPESRPMLGMLIENLEEQ